MTDLDELDRAEARAIAARARMNATLGALQTRLTPQGVAQEALDRIGDTGALALDAGVKAAKRHPAKVACGAALLAAFLGRRHIGKMIARLPRAKRKER